MAGETELQACAERAGASDVLVLRRVEGDRFLQIGGYGRGAGWAGNVELHGRDEPLVAEALEHGVARRADPTPRRIAGPYFAACAVAVSMPPDHLVLLGGSAELTAAVAADASARTVAEDVLAAVESVGPAKRLADELEVVHAVNDVVTIADSDLDGALAAVADRIAAALACEYGALYLPASSPVGERLFVADRGWSPAVPPAELLALLRTLYDEQSGGRCVNDVGAAPLPPRFGDDITAYLIEPIGTEPLAMVFVAHTVVRPRGFTLLCQRLAKHTRDAAEAVVQRCLARAELEAERVDAERRSRIDALTGLANRHALIEQAGLLLERGGALGVLLIDVDRFKRINDGYGHGAGDQVLTELSRRLEAAVRACGRYAIVGRWGGEEFMVLAPGLDDAGLRRLGESARVAIGDAPIEAGGRSITVTASIGVAPRVARRDDLAQLVDAADQALYAAKRRGRDRVVLVDDLRLEDLEAHDQDAVHVAEALALAAASRRRGSVLDAHRAAELATRLACRLGLPAERVARVRLAALTSDVGICAMPGDVAETREAGAELGAALLGRIPSLACCAEIVRLQHRPLLDAPIETQLVVVAHAYTRARRDGQTEGAAIRALGSDPGVPPGLLELLQTETAGVTRRSTAA